MGNAEVSTIVIGAGASGMMAAITAARRGKSVLVLEHLKQAGKKLNATGNGKCNFTNERMGADCYHGDSGLIGSVLSQFSRDDALGFFREIGIYPKNKRGYYYPNCEQASAVVEALTAEMERLGIPIVTEADVRAVAPEKTVFCCRTDRQDYRGRNVIFATGLLASPKLGSDGSAISLIKELGHRFVPILPALCGFHCEGMRFRRVAGVRADAALTLRIGGQKGETERGELQLADYGLSGIPMFQLSSQAARALYEKKPVEVHIDFLPDIPAEELFLELARRFRRGAGAESGQLLCGLLQHKLIPECLDAAGIGAQVEEEAALGRLAAVLKDYPVTLLKARGMEYAQVCAGGVRTEEIDICTLESRIHPGLYFAGELLDADGICGGYNLQWAWASGYVAGSHVEDT